MAKVSAKIAAANKAKAAAVRSGNRSAAKKIQNSINKLNGQQRQAAADAQKRLTGRRARGSAVRDTGGNPIGNATLRSAGLGD